MNSSIPRSAQDLCTELANSAVERPPSESVYHYTDGKAILGILDKEVLWASNARFLNDSSELRVAYDLTEQIAGRKRNQRNKILPAEGGMSAAQRAQGELLLRIGHLMRTADDNHNLDAYIVCFSTKHDALSQWRGYAGAAGYNVGIKPDLLIAAAESVYPRMDVRFGKVGYEHLDWVQKMEQLIEILVESIGERVSSKGDAFRERLAERYSSAVAQCVTLAAPFMKDGGFEEESEVRLSITRDASYNDFQFRSSTSGIIPYLEVPVQSSVESICLGPGLDYVLQRRALSLKRLADSIKIFDSAIPFRT